MNTFISTTKNDEELLLESGSTIFVSITFDNPTKLKREVDKSSLLINIYQGYGLNEYYKSFYLLVEDVKILPALEGQDFFYTLGRRQAPMGSDTYIDVTIEKLDQNLAGEKISVELVFPDLPTESITEFLQPQDDSRACKVKFSGSSRESHNKECSYKAFSDLHYGHQKIQSIIVKDVCSASK